MKAVLVTGAYGGMGRAAVAMLKSKGYLVFALDLKVGEAEEGIVPVACDVTSEASVLAAYDYVRERAERIDAMIHYAGIYTLDSFVEMMSIY